METEVFIQDYLKSHRRKWILVAVFALIAVSALFITLGFGVYKISVIDAINVAINHIMGKGNDYYDELYVWDVRMPRAILAVTIGAGLALSGVIMQNVMHNPMAEPYTMGVSSGSFFGVVLVMCYGICLLPGYENSWGLVINAFVFALVPVIIILILSTFKTLSPTAMILVGIAIMYLFSSITQLILIQSPSETVAEAYNWRVGSLSLVKWETVGYIVPVVVLASIGMFALSKKLDMMYMGDRNAKTVGINANRLRIVSMVLVSVMTAAIVSFTGTIGFVGLVAPHIARMIVGSSNKYLMPFSMVFGAAFLVLADTIAKVSGANGLPVGVISSMVGGPLFLYILIKRGKKVWS